MINRLLLVGILCLSLSSCVKDIEPKNLKEQNLASADVASRWAALTLDCFKHGYKNSPTYSSRSLAYLGICMYECARHADTTYRSLVGQLSGLNSLPQPDGGPYDWKIVLTSGQETLLKKLYPLNENASQAQYQKINGLAAIIYANETIGLDPAITKRSVALGAAIANAIYVWSTTDGGHAGFSRHFDPTFIFPHGESYWQPPAVGQVVSAFPLHPTWGNNRRFVPANASLPVPAIIPYSKDPSSPYYQQYKDVYTKNKTLTLEEKEIAAWWTDDPTETFSPPGHSCSIASIAIRKSNASLVKAAETYARIGIATADAFIHVWKAKYTYFNERPSSFVRKNIDPFWDPYWPEPPFPAFPSGHAIQGSASATVLEDIYGTNFSFTDNSHEGASRFSNELKYAPRHFSSFWQAAEESAYSRFLGGIHTKQDNDTGLAEGKKIGANVNALQWKK